jgi:eukaryotic-like serine/threonine-protein kinase
MEPTSSKPSGEPLQRRGMPRMLGRYELLGALARGGMATVYLGRHRGEAGFQRLFAIKVMHEHLADDEEFVAMLLDEARIAARLHHPNVVPIVDLGSQDGLHYVVMEYIEGCSLAALLKKFQGQRPPRLLLPIVIDVLAGLHAAHSLKDDDGNPMNLVHRDVSPQNVMVGIDGTARITDFGIARAESRIMSTRPGQLKGKLAFMAPEQIRGTESVDCRADLFSAGAMLWSALTGRRLFLADSDAATLSNILQLTIPPPSTVGCQPPQALDVLFERALERDPDKRFQSAQEMEEALRDAAMAAACFGSRREVAAWVQAGFGDELEERRRAIKTAADVPRPQLDSVLSGSGMIPSVGSFTPSHSSGQVAVSTELPTQNSIVAPGSASAALLPTVGRKRSRLLLAVGGGGFAVAMLVVLGVVLVTRGPAPPAAAEPLVETAAPIAAPAPSPVVTLAPAVEQPPPPAASSEPAEAEPPRPRAGVRWSAPRKLSNPEPADKPTATAPVPPPPTAAPAKSPKRWDKDSPGLPPE